MSDRILTLFGDELMPEQPRPAPRTKAKKRKDEDDTDNAATSGENELVEEQDAQQLVADTHFIDVADADEPQMEAADAIELAPFVENNTTNTEEVVTATVAPQFAEEATTTTKKGRKQEKEEPPLTNLSEDWSGEKNYYTIGDVAELFKVKTSNIRFWTNEFNIKVRTTRKGDRLYTPEQIKELRAIYHLVKERKFTLSGARARLKSSNKKDVETIDLKQSLLALRAKLVTLKSQLNKV